MQHYARVKTQDAWLSSDLHLQLLLNEALLMPLSSTCTVIHKLANFQVARLIFIYVTFKLNTYCFLKHVSTLENKEWTFLPESVRSWPFIVGSFEDGRKFYIKPGWSKQPALLERINPICMTCTSVYPHQKASSNHSDQRLPFIAVAKILHFDLHLLRFNRNFCGAYLWKVLAGTQGVTA